MDNYNLKAKDHRANARAMLGNNIFDGKWMMALLVVFLFSVILSFASSITFYIATLIIIGPLSIGLSRFFLNLSRGGEAKLEKLFSGFEDGFEQNLLIGLMVYLFTFLWSLLFIIPGIVKGYAYSMAYYVKCDNPSLNWKQCIDESQRIMKGKKWKLFCLDLSFIGWIIVGSFVCGIGTLWVEPYMQAARTSFYESIKESTENTAEQQAYEF